LRITFRLVDSVKTRLAPGALDFKGYAAGQIAADALLRVIRDLHPDVLRELSEIPYPAMLVDQRAKKGVLVGKLSFSQALLAWSVRWNLKARRIHSAAAQVIEEWQIDPAARDRLDWPRATSNTLGAVSLPTRSDRRDPLTPVSAMPSVETEAEFVARARAHWNAVVVRMKEAGHDDALVKSADRQHFEWFVRHQVLGEPLRALARTARVDPATVRQAVKRLAALLQVQLRERQRGGRPRRATSVKTEEKGPAR
jgi:hypothetical protein